MPTELAFILLGAVPGIVILMAGWVVYIRTFVREHRVSRTGVRLQFYGFVVFCLGGWIASAILCLAKGLWPVALAILPLIAFLVWFAVNVKIGVEDDDRP